MNIPESLREAVMDVLRAMGDSSSLQHARSPGGGCINHALRLETAQHVYLLKWNADPLPDMFPTEARGLALMQATETVRVPEVYHASNATAEHPAYILLEWLEGAVQPASPPAQTNLGRQVAAMHQASVPFYGLDHDNYLGTSPQHNQQDDDWLRFYREQRLRPQIDMAQRGGRMTSARRRRLERVLDNLERWLGGVQRRPALLHGDLWGGNVIPGPGDAPALIDPAVYYGDREAEIAYTQLFGGFRPQFYQGYEEVWPLEADYEDRRDLYNLYHLLNHLNIFGESYGSQVDAVAQRYAG